MASIGTTRVEEVMVTKIVAVKTTDSMEDVARTFETNDINAAPVIGTFGKCVGIITSHDLVEYESKRASVLKELCNSKYAVKITQTEELFRPPGTRYNEAGFHMTTSLQTALPDDPLSRVARKMCSQHIHHVLVLDKDEKPIGFLSSLDLLGFVVGEPVCRSTNCPIEQE